MTASAARPLMDTSSLTRWSKRRWLMSESTETDFLLPDVNVLVALTNPAHQHHTQAHHWLSEVERFATTPITEYGLVRLLLNPAVTGQEIVGAQATGILTALRADTRAIFFRTIQGSPPRRSISSGSPDTDGPLTSTWSTLPPARWRLGHIRPENWAVLGSGKPTVCADSGLDLIMPVASVPDSYVARI